MKIAKNLLVLIIFFIFIYLRLSPIINRTVPYTYDQGRDFLKVEEIVRDKNLTFIGPTTGMAGVNHGAWWYYFLLVPQIIFNGWPQGFYLFLLLVNLGANILFYLFLNVNFGFIPAIFYLLTISVSPYFMRNAFFVSNDMLSPIFVLLLIYSLYKLFERKDIKYLLLTGLALGFILETEVAFGIFLIPVSIITLTIFKQFNNIKSFLFFFVGLSLPMLPRLLFEIKNNFIQTKAFIYNLTLKKDAHPLLFRAVFDERLKTFVQYWKDLFYDNNIIISLIIFSLILYFYLFHRKSLTNLSKKTLLYFIFTVIFLLFIFSLFFQGNFFYGYYFQGLQYFYLMIVVILIYEITKNKKTVFFSYLLVFIFLLINIFAFIKDIGNQKTIPLLGLRADDQIVRYVYERNKNKKFCLRIYTPPVIPYTYDYLLNYYSRINKYQRPSGRDPIDNKCWYIIDKDDNNERVTDWRKNNVPANTKIIENKIMDNGTSIELWSF